MSSNRGIIVLNGGQLAFCLKCGFVAVSDVARDLAYFERVHAVYPVRFPFLHIHNLGVCPDKKRSLCCCGFRFFGSRPFPDSFHEEAHLQNVPRELRARGIICR